MIRFFPVAIIFLLLLLLLVGCEEEITQSPSISLFDTDKLVTSEAGGIAKFSVVLNSTPNSSVEIPFHTDNAAEGLISTDQTLFNTTASLQFTSFDWHIPKTIYIKGIDDETNDHDVVFKIISDPVISSDSDYDSINLVDVSVTNLAIDFVPGQTSRAVIVTPSTALVTSEDGSKHATIQLALNKGPSANVVVTVASQNIAEGIPQSNQSASLTFTQLNWNQAQSVNIIGVDDFVIDGDISYEITFSTQSTDIAFDGLTVAPVTLINEDNDSVVPTPVNITVLPVNGLMTSETPGATNNVTISMSFSESPAVSETITVTAGVSDSSEASISPASVTVDSSNWQSLPVFTLTGLDDEFVDGDQNYTVSFSASSSLGTASAFHNTAIPSLQATNSDNDSASVSLLLPPAGIQTSENQNSVSFTVVLDAAPLSDVSISAAVSNLQEASIDPSSLRFSPSGANLWSQAQTFVVTGVDDNIVDGDQAYIITLNSSSANASFDGLLIPTVDASNSDNDVASISVTTPTGGVVTSENLIDSSISVVLDKAPLADVIVSAISSDTTEGEVSPASLTFSASGTNAWNLPQTIIISGVNDNAVDGDQAYTIRLSSSSANTSFNGLLIPDVAASNSDNDIAAVSVATPTGGVVTSENLKTSSMTVMLDAAPLADVVVSATSSNTTEGIVSPSSLTFSPSGANAWNLPQEIIVTGVNDNFVDGDQSYMIDFATTSSNVSYNALVIPSVSATNLDNDVPSVSVVLPTSGIVTSESSSTATITVTLNTVPGDDVVITATSLNLSEGIINPASLTFGSVGVNAWDIPQTFTVQGVNDSVVDGDQIYSIDFASSSVDTNYNNLAIASVSATNTDNDVATVLVSVPTGGIVTSEDATSVSFEIVLDTAPVADVQIIASSLNLAEGTISPASLTFSPSGTNIWNQSQSFTVTGVDDSAVDGDQDYSISLSSSSTNAAYNGVVIPVLTATNTDNDIASVTMALPVGGIATSENLTSAPISVVLDAAPLVDVVISASSLNLAEGTITPNNLTFSPSGTNIWNQAQIFTVTGVDDNIVDGSQTYDIAFSSTSTQTAYDAISISNVSATNSDNDIATLTVTTPVGGVITSEDLSSASINIVLDVAPLFDVVVAINTSNSGEAEATPASVRFSPSGINAWNIPQSISITGVDDSIVDGDQPYSIAISTSSFQSDFDNMAIPSILATNTDNEIASVSVTLPVGGVITSENQDSATFSVVLDVEPIADVTVTAASSLLTEGKVSPASLTFSPNGENNKWNQEQSFRVTGVNDSIVDGDQIYAIKLTTTSLNAAYNALSIPDVVAINTDNDVAPITIVTPVGGIVTTEAGATDTFTVVLDSAPTADVAITIDSLDLLEATTSPASLLFTAAGVTAWNIPQTVTVTGVDDNDVDGNQIYNISLSASSLDTAFNGIVITNIQGINNDDDIAGVTLLLPSEGIVTSESGSSDTFSVVLDSAPSVDVTVFAASFDTTEGIVTPASLTFSRAGTNLWNQAQTFTVTGQSDNLNDGNQQYSISLTSSSGDAIYNAFVIPTIIATNNDSGEEKESSSFSSKATNIPLADVNVTNSGLTQTSETGGSVVLNISLNTMPTADVVVTPYSDDESEAMVRPRSLTFTAANWQSGQPIQVIGRDDTVIDGTINYMINFKADSLDQYYDTDYGFTVSPLALANIDDDSVVPAPLAVKSHDISIVKSSIPIYDELGMVLLDQYPATGYRDSASPASAAIPGPTINLIENQSLQIFVSNLSNYTQNFFVQYATSPPAIQLLASETNIEYSFSILPAGIFSYASLDVIDRALGQYGAIVVRPSDGSKTAWNGGPGFDTERTWVIADLDSSWNLNADPETIDTTTYQPDTVLINGETGFRALNNPLTTLQGTLEDLLLVRMINAGQYAHTLHFHGNRIKIISQGGVKSSNYADLPYVNSVQILNNSTAMILVRLTDLGDSLVHLHTFEETDLANIISSDVTTMRVNQ